MTARAKALFGVAASVLLLWWVLRDVSLTAVARELRGVRPGLFLLAVTLATAGFAVRAARWRVLLLPFAPDVPFRPRFAATTLGFAANNLLPARVGELVRAHSLARLSRASTAGALASLAVERLLDGLVLACFLFAVMAAPAFPASRMAGVHPWLGGLLVLSLSAALLLGFVLVALRPQALLRLAGGVFRRMLPEKARAAVSGFALAFVEGLSVLRDPRLFALSLLWALFQWAFLALSYLAAFRAFGIEVGYTGAVFLQSLVSLAVSIPSSPGFFGPFEAAARVGLELYGVPGEKAVSFAVGFHLGGFVPVTLIGLYYLGRTGLGWRELGAGESRG